MIKGENIICISNTNWFGSYAKSTVQILERLARNNNILFVEYPYTIKDLITDFSEKKFVPSKRMLGLEKRLQQITTDSGTKVYNLIIPPGIPVYFLKNEKIFNFFFRFNTYIYQREVKKTMKKLNFQNPILLTAYNPFYGLSMHGRFNEKVHIYYCYDGVESGFFGKRIFKFEDIFSQKVKAIITSSDYLNAGKLKLNANSFVVKNGVNFPAFQKFAKHSLYMRKRKSVGYIGTLDPRFDIDIVEYAVQELSDFDFEFTGDMRNEAMKARLSVYPNVHFFSPIKPKDVPELLAKYDVGIIPYIVNEVNKNIYPLKINEYLAVGVPVVMTSFADLPEFSNIVSVVRDKYDFVEKLKIETSTDSEEKIKKRIDFASQNSWEARAIEFGNIIEKYI